MFKLSIKDPIVVPDVPRNMYMLHVHSYHGDGDLNEEQTYKFESNAVHMEKLHALIGIFQAYKDAGQPYAITTTDWEQFIQSSNVDVSSLGEYPIDWVTGLLAWDCTNGGQYLTTFEDYRITFFDFNGIEREVEVTQAQETEED